MKLIRSEIAENRRQLASMYHCCRWCKYFQHGKCYNKEMIDHFVNYSSDYTYKVAEEGVLSSVLSETFHSIPKNAVTEKVVSKLRSYGLSERRIKEIFDTLVTSIDSWFDDTVEVQLDIEVSSLYNLSDCCVDGINIQNPNEFCCERFE